MVLVCSILNMLHIKLKGMNHTIICEQIFTLIHTPLTPGVGQKVIFSFLKVVHIKSNGNEA